MKNILKIAVLLLFSTLFLSCLTQRGITKTEATKLVIKDSLSGKDSTEYELIVFDSRFEFWLGSHSYVKNQHSNEYYQSMNSQYVQEWNRRYSSGDRMIDSYIDYDSRIKYPLELNYRLFMYFKYFEETNRVRLIPGMGRLL